MNNNNTILISCRTLRQLIGVLRYSSALLCWGINIFVNHFDLLHNSLLVSHLEGQYQAGANQNHPSVIFIILPQRQAIYWYSYFCRYFLLHYNGYTPNPQNDRWVWLNDKKNIDFCSMLSSGIVVFPTDSYAHFERQSFIFETNRSGGKIHLSFAALFFISMAVMSIVNFRRLPE